MLGCDMIEAVAIVRAEAQALRTAMIASLDPSGFFGGGGGGGGLIEGYPGQFRHFVLMAY